ncbi:MAG: radical SAM protein [Ignavibacteriae bacterium]|nr:MAG: radical SAM protein [Ignavibacteriota bacterium]
MRSLFINTPHYDTDSFLGTPTSIHYATALLTNNTNFIKDGTINFFEPLTQNDYYSNLEFYSINKIYDIYAFSSTSHSHWIALKGATIVKKHQPSSIIIFGGPHEDELIKAGLSEQTIHKWREFVDVVVKGDGEFALEWVLSNLQTNCVLDHLYEISSRINKIPGKGFIDLKSTDNNIYSFRLSGSKLDLNKLPFINWNFVAENNFYNYPIFKEKNNKVKKTAQLITHRGCKGGCRYCSESQLFNQRSVENVIQEIKTLIIKYDVKAIFFDDSTFTDDRKYTVSLCNELIKLNIEWGCLTRFDKVDTELLKLMKESGCSYIYFGLEQYDNDILNKIGKRLDTNKIDEAIHLCFLFDIRVGLSCLFGIGETNKIAVKTIMKVSQWIREKSVVIVSISANCIHLGTKNIINDKDKLKVTFDQEPPHKGFPWIAFEEGIWHHPEQFSEKYANFLLEKVIRNIPIENLARKKLLLNHVNQLM